jgi:uncharacterized peroxidase-related enzyme
VSFIKMVSEKEAIGAVKELYEAEAAKFGYIPNYLKLLSHRPDVYKAWMTLGAAVSKDMSLRRYELVTLAAARKLEGTYCMLAHGEAFLKSGEVDGAQLAAIARDYHDAQLSPEDVAVMEFAEKVITESSSVTQADVDRLKSFGISDAEVLDITVASAYRSFVSRMVDALNVRPDTKLMALDGDLRHALSVGRTFDGAE